MAQGHNVRAHRARGGVVRCAHALAVDRPVIAAWTAALKILKSGRSPVTGHRPPATGQISVIFEA